MKLRIAMLALLVAVVAQPVQGDQVQARKLISEAAARMVSELTYTELLRQAMSKG